jgi:hypothetical protein
MVESSDVPLHNLPPSHLRDELCRLVAVVAHPQVLGYPDSGSRRCSQQPEGDDQLLAVITEDGGLLVVVNVMEHARRVPLAPHPLPECVHVRVHELALRVCGLATGGSSRRARSSCSQALC